MPAPVAAGEILGGKYRVNRVLGEGGMGVVVAATHLHLDQRVAIKFMLPEAFKNPESLARFAREGRAAVKLRSEHVARVLDTGTFESGAPYIVMEYLEGTDLAGEIERGGPMSPQVAAEYLVQACEAIAEAHSLGIVHRDLKPANLFLTKRADGSPLVKVLDFGISKATGFNEADLGMTKTSAVMGSPLYMSPEQMKSSKDVDTRTDVWSLGVILYELLGGRPPFNAETFGELLAAVLTEAPPPLATVRAGLPPALCGLVDRCLQKDRSLRCRSVAEIARGLAPFCPPRVMPLVERVSLILGEGAGAQVSAQAVSPHAQTAPAVIPGAPGSAPAQTGSGWGGTQDLAPAPPRSRAGVWAAVGAVVVVALAGVGFIALKERGTRVVDAPATSVIAPPSPTTAVAMAPPPPSAAAAPSASASLSAPSAAPPPAVAVATTRGAPGGKAAPAPAPPKSASPPGTAPATPATPAPPPPAPTATTQKPGILDTSN